MCTIKKSKRPVETTIPPFYTLPVRVSRRGSASITVRLAYRSSGSMSLEYETPTNSSKPCAAVPKGGGWTFKHRLEKIRKLRQTSASQGARTNQSTRNNEHVGHDSPWSLWPPRCHLPTACVAHGRPVRAPWRFSMVAIVVSLDGRPWSWWGKMTGLRNVMGGGVGERGGSSWSALLSYSAVAVHAEAGTYQPGA